MRIALIALMLVGCGQPAQPQQSDKVTVTLPAPKLTDAQVIAKLDACVLDESCSSRPIMEELWRRGYCNIDARGQIGHCSKAQIENDKRVTAALDGEG